jgi:hypothetical protein
MGTLGPIYEPLGWTDKSCLILLCCLFKRNTSTLKHVSFPFDYTRGNEKVVRFLTYSLFFPNVSFNLPHQVSLLEPNHPPHSIPTKIFNSRRFQPSMASSSKHRCVFFYLQWRRIRMRIRCSLLLEEKYVGFHFILFSCSVALKFCSDLYVFLFDFLMDLPVEEVDF